MGLKKSRDIFEQVQILADSSPGSPAEPLSVGVIGGRSAITGGRLNGRSDLATRSEFSVHSSDHLRNSICAICVICGSMLWYFKTD
jgi:hypothetical protein